MELSPDGGLCDKCRFFFLDGLRKQYIILHTETAHANNEHHLYVVTSIMVDFESNLRLCHRIYQRFCFHLVNYLRVW